MKALNAWLETEQNYLMRLAAIDPTGLTDQEKTSRELLMRDFAEDRRGSGFKEWEMPVNQMGGIYSDYPQLVAAAELHKREGLRRLDRAAARHAERVRPGDDEYVDRHGRQARSAEVSA